MPGRTVAIAVLSFGLGVSAPAFADIKAFNAAVTSGDYKTAASEAEVIWKTWDASDSQTAVVAREFGFAALVAGRNELGREFGQFLVDKGATLTTPDTEPWVSAVLLRVTDYRIKRGEAELKALRDALVTRSASPGLDMTSVLAWETLYLADSAKSDLVNIEKDAAAAAAFMSRVPALLVRQRSAELHAASAAFIAGRNRVTKGKNSYYDAMADLHDRIVADITNAQSPNQQALLWPLKWRAEAWALAMQAYLGSTYSQIGSNISTDLQARRLVRPSFAQYPEDPESANQPLCEGSFSGRRMTYPSSKAYRGLVGSVIARMETAPNGKVTKVEVLAAIPVDGFDDKVVETLGTWTYKADKNAKQGGCRLNSRNLIYRVTFNIG
jgi:TonB family protein